MRRRRVRAKSAASWTPQGLGRCRVGGRTQGALPQPSGHRGPGGLGFCTDSEDADIPRDDVSLHSHAGKWGDQSFNSDLTYSKAPGNPRP